MDMIIYFCANFFNMKDSNQLNREQFNVYMQVHVHVNEYTHLL